MSPPIDALMEKLVAEDFFGAAEVWRQYCQSEGACQRNFTNQMPVYLYCAKMLEACLWAQSLGGHNAENQKFETQARKLRQWVSEQE